MCRESWLLVLGDGDIRTAHGEMLIIEPFDTRKVTSVGYDVSVGDFVYVLGGDLLTLVDGSFLIPSGRRVLMN